MECTKCRDWEPRETAGKLTAALPLRKKQDRALNEQLRPSSTGDVMAGLQFPTDSAWDSAANSKSSPVARGPFGMLAGDVAVSGNAPGKTLPAKIQQQKQEVALFIKKNKIKGNPSCKSRERRSWGLNIAYGND